MAQQIFVYLFKLLAMLILLISVLFIIGLSCDGCAQELYDDYRLYKVDRDVWEEYMVSSDTSLFYNLQQHPQDLYEELSDYKFSFVEFARRGQFYADRHKILDGIMLRNENISALRRLGVAEQRLSGLALGMGRVDEGIVGIDLYSTHEAAPIDAINLSTFVSGRSYLGGARATIHSTLGRGWSGSLYASAKGGDDLYVKGVYNDALDLALRLNKKFASGASLSLVALSLLSERGLRSGTTQEVFTLRADKLYNPTWGYQSGEVRNSRTRQDKLPFVLMSYSQTINSSTQMLVSLGGNYGSRNYRNLGWYDAMSPRPDNYRYLPSYFSSEAVAQKVEEVWRMGDERYTQVDWDELYEVNRISRSGAVYALEGRVERRANAEAVVNFSSRMRPNLTLDYGVRLRYDNSRNFKRMEDLLGALYLADLDYYLMDDDTFSAKQQNNLQDPNRKVQVGDRFSYDYALEQFSSSLDLMLHYGGDRWLLDMGLSFGQHHVFRRGYFEKEIYRGDKSLGRSAVVKFSPYTFKARLGYSFSPQHFADIAVAVSDVAPQAEDLFHNPQYNNRVVDNPQAEHRLSAEMNYNYKFSVGQIALSAYVLSKSNIHQTMRLYDDLSARYCDVDVASLGEACYGVEVAGDFTLTKNLELSTTAAIGRYIYTSNPTVTHYDDRDGSLINRSVSYMGDCYIGGAPQLSAMAELTYFTYRGWVASCSAQLVAMRYVDPSFIRRTERVAHQASLSPEIYDAFITQHRLSDAVTLDAGVSRWFDVGRGRLSFTLSVRNLLGRNNIEYGGYEQSRIRNYQSGTRRVYMPMDDVITYAYPRTFYAVISWKM